MNILVKASCNHSDLVSWCTYALITLTPAGQQQVLARRELLQMVKARDADLSRIEFWHFADFYEDLNLDALSDDQRAKLESDEYVILPDGFDPIVDAQRTECDHLVIEERGFYWRAILKHTDLHVETRQLPYELVAP